MTETPRRLLILIQEALPPALNMGWDEALGLAVRRGRFGGFLRFYRWSPPTLSFGYFQKPSRILLPEAMSHAELGLVRRASGGKMVFHDQEWTFSCGMPIDLLKHQQTSAHPDGFLGWFQTLLGPLVETLRELGVPVRFPESRHPNRPGVEGPGKEVPSKKWPGNETPGEGIVPPAFRDRVHCFSAAAGHSLMVQGKKLIGAAGIARDGVLVVHGSLPIARSCPLPPIFCHRVDPEAGLETAFLSDFLDPQSIASLPVKVAEHMVSSFHFDHRQIPDTTFPEQPLLVLAEALARKKYDDLDWPVHDQGDCESLIEHFFKR